MIEISESEILINEEIHKNLKEISYPAKKAMKIIEDIDSKGKILELNKIVSFLEVIKNKCC